MFNDQFVCCLLGWPINVWLFCWCCSSYHLEISFLLIAYTYCLTPIHKFIQTLTKCMYVQICTYICMLFNQRILVRIREKVGQRKCLGTIHVYICTYIIPSKYVLIYPHTHCPKFNERPSPAIQFIPIQSTKNLGQSCHEMYMYVYMYLYRPNILCMSMCKYIFFKLIHL